jgi:hypothetical protein
MANRAEKGPPLARSWCRPAASKRQLIEGVIWQFKEHFGLERHRAFGTQTVGFLKLAILCHLKGG